MPGLNEIVALASSGAHRIGAAFARAMAAAGATMALCDIAATYYCAEVLLTPDAPLTAKPRRCELVAIAPLVARRGR